MSRSFETRVTEHGTDVIDDQGTRWAGFEASNPNATLLATAYLGLVRSAFIRGQADALWAHEGDISITKAGSIAGGPTWDIVVDRDGDNPLASMPRSRLQMAPPHHVRDMLSVANQIYAIGQVELEADIDATLSPAI